MIVGQKVHHRHREGAKNQSQRQRDGGPQQGGNPHGPADALLIPLAPVLAHQDAKAALKAEDDAGEKEHRHVGGGNGGHFGVSQAGDHECVNEPQGKGNEILQDHGEGELEEPFVKAGLAA